MNPQLMETGRTPGGTRIAARYVLGALLGRGGTARVYTAHDTVLDRPVAVRIATLRDDDSVRRQALLTSRIRHPRVVRVLDVGTWDNRHWSVLDLVEGSSLKQILSVGPQPTPAQVQALAIAILDGLDHIHQLGLVHGDLSVGNILVPHAQGKMLWDQPVLIDVGAPVHVQGQVVVSPQYAAPEVACGQPPAVASDLYAVGAVIYHALTGRPPFTGHGIQVLEAHVKQTLVPPTSRQPELAGRWDQIVLCAMDKEPTARFISAKAMGEALQGADLTEPQTQSGAQTGAQTGAQFGAQPGAQPGAQSGAQFAAQPDALSATGADKPLLPAPRKPSAMAVAADKPLLTAPRKPPAVAVVATLVAAFCVTGLAIGASAIGSSPVLAAPAASAPYALDETAPAVTATAPVVVSTPGAVAAVPDLIGLSVMQASAALSQLGLALGAVEQVDVVAASGTVVSTSPAAGTVLEPGAAVVVRSASGYTVVPDVQGLTCSRADGRLQTAGLQTTVVTPGVVTSQNPGPGVRYPLGSAVTLRCHEETTTPEPGPSASGPTTTPPPDPEATPAEPS